VWHRDRVDHDADALPANARAVGGAAPYDDPHPAVREYPEGTRTAQDAADAIGVDVGQIVKSLIFTVDGEVVVALVSGPNRLDEARLAEAAGRPGAPVGRANADAVREATGYPIGGVPPLGHAHRLATFLDEDLLGYDEVWAAAGTPHHNFAVDPGELVRATGATVAPLRAG
jgi:prolyl-tRNA editing enzyme YbaK/EbsC (Cys-tRNA(Pro) deacylase)